MVSFPPKSALTTPLPTTSQSASLLRDTQDQQLDQEDDYELEMSLANSALNGRRNSDKERGSHPFRALTPKRVALIAGGVLLLIFWFGKGTGGGRDGYAYAAEGSTDIAPKEAEVPVSKLPPSSPQKQPGASSKKCTPPPGQKATTYALMIDAGSTGSRLHLYTFSHCDPTPGALPKLEDEGFYTTKPGLSSYAGRPEEAAESLRSLMQHAVGAEGVPEKERSCTPIAVKATAGLRLLGERESNEILQEVERWLTNEWPFTVVEDGVTIMDGRDEGTFTFITFLLLDELERRPDHLLHY